MSQRCGWPNELSGVMTTATVVEIGSLLFNPVHLIFDNQSTSPVAISVNDNTGTNVWKTFSAGETLILDMRGNKGMAANFTADIGTTYYGAGTTASGDFKISYTYAGSDQ